MEELHTDGLGGEDVRQVVAVDTVLAHKPFEDVETLRSEYIDAALFEEV